MVNEKKKQRTANMGFAPVRQWCQKSTFYFTFDFGVQLSISANTPARSQSPKTLPAILEDAKP
jgi:hypothetical protein